MNKKQQQIINLIEEDGMVDGSHHKQWILDQILRIILKKEYNSWLEKYNSETDENGEIYGEWDQGIAP